MIRNDLIDDFISYVNQKDYPLKSSINPSIYETNVFLLKSKPTLIEYAAFFGSIQIFKYLYLNGVNLTSSLWIYAIHGDNPEMIHILEENNIEPDDYLIENEFNDDSSYDDEDEDISYEKCLEEAIKCHHNYIANYIRTQFINDMNENYYIENNFDNNVIAYCFRHYNFAIFLNEDDFNDIFLFYYLCQYDYYNLVEFFIQTREININETIV